MAAAEPSVVRLPTSSTSTDIGLRAAEVEERRAAGKTNVTPDRTSRSVGEIIGANVFTRFNAIIALLAAVIFVFGHPMDAMFAMLMVLNTAIGVVQELRAKRTLDRLRILIAPTITVVRDGIMHEVATTDLVVDDHVVLEVGDQVPVDAIVADSDGLELDESALTGEADPVAKGTGDEVRSGSAVVAGSGRVIASRVGTDTWINGLVAQAKEFVLTRSELRVGVDRILRIISWMLPPLTVLLVYSQVRHNDTLAEGLVSAVAGVVALVPQGLVLLVSMALAVAVLRLANNHVVVQELGAVEGLARIDIICVDKTGTLTTGRLVLERIEPIGRPEQDIRRGLAALAHSEASPTAIMRVLASGLGDAPGWQAMHAVPFSSARKWSSTSFDGQGSWIVGAPEVLLDHVRDASVMSIRERVGALADEGRRVVLGAWCRENVIDEVLPAEVEPVAIIVFAEQLRPDAHATMQYFGEQGVTVKVLSGDNPRTVSAVARQLGMPGADHYVDMRNTDIPMHALVDDNTVFGRVLPDQKRELVAAMQAAGHTVAMTGDGVNDIPALKLSDIAIAMDTATPATKAVAQLVLLDGRFDRLPQVVAEGRRVIANMERVSSLFITKTVYGTLFALVVAIIGFSYPFLPRHLSIVADITIGVPAFALSFRSSNAPCRPGYLRRVMEFSLPAGLAAAIVTLASYGLVRSSLFRGTVPEARTAATISLTVVGMWVLYHLANPLDRLEIALMVALAAAFASVLTIPPLARLYAIDFPAPRATVTVCAVVAGSLLALQLALPFLRVLPRKRPTAQ